MSSLSWCASSVISAAVVSSRRSVAFFLNDFRVIFDVSRGGNFVGQFNQVQNDRQQCFNLSLFFETVSQGLGCQSGHAVRTVPE